ncbi:MAG: FAD-binding oxidoreductase [candidate division WOR-3 bacterium]|uniref:FAD-binding oxidoreductase n=1 Tax=candidate division WOR-3 bacterium TaxID=2052148 RepID=A0A7C1SCD4_UNCW3|nr:FAD-binding oxidoreductase [candidate division WOR-3 bacterium]
MSRKTADAVIVGGGIIGAAVGYHLAKAGFKVALLEKKFPCAGSTGRCIGGIRAQFSHELTIKVMLLSIKLFQNFKEEVGEDIEWYAGGYLFLAFDEERKKSFGEAIEIQRRCGLDVAFVSADECARIVPGLNTEGLIGGAWCPTDGQANPFKVTFGYLKRMRDMGSKVYTETEVVGINIHKGRVVSVVTNKGDEFFAPVVLNAAGPWASEVGRMAGVEVPVAPDRHEALVTEAVERCLDPMLVDYRSDGCYFLQHYGTGHIIGCYTPVPLVPGYRLDSSDEFVTEMPRRMIRLLPKLSSVKVLRQWAGSYEMSPDGNPICGKTSVEGYYVAAGMSGHGFMFGPAIGKLMAELITTGKSTIDLSEFQLDRSFTKSEAMK